MRRWYSMEWTRLSIICPDVAEEAVVGIMNDLTTTGPLIEKTEAGTRVAVYFPSRQAANDARASLQSRLVAIPDYLTGGRLEVQMDTVHEQTWGEAWKKHYHAFRIGRRLVIKPSWEGWPPDDDPEAAAQDDVIVEIDPGQAFGTGQHQTTRLCLRVLEDLVNEDTRFLDVGCGSGILSIAAAALGADRITAVDTDEVAVETTRENIAGSQFAPRITVIEGNIDAAPAEYTIIAANITAPTVKAVAHTVYRKLKPGGYYVTSGFTHKYTDGVEQKLAETGFQVADTRREDEWRCVVGRRPD